MTASVRRCFKRSRSMRAARRRGQRLEQVLAASVRGRAVGSIVRASAGMPACRRSCGCRCSSCRGVDFDRGVEPALAAVGLVHAVGRRRTRPRPAAAACVRASKAEQAHLGGAAWRTCSMSCGAMRASTTSFSRAGTTSSSGSRGADHRAGGGHAQRHHLAVDRRAHGLALDLVLRRAQPLFDLAHLGGGSLQLVGRRCWYCIAQLRDARCAARRRAGAPARVRCGTRRGGCGSRRRCAAAPIRRVRWTKPCCASLSLMRELFVRQRGRRLGRVDLRFERRGLRCASRDLRCSARSARRACGGARRTARARAPGARPRVRRRESAGAVEARRERGLGLGARAADALGAPAGPAAGSARRRCARRRPPPAARRHAPVWPSRTRISRTMPPSWCCTVLRLSSTLTAPARPPRPTAARSPSRARTAAEHGAQRQREPQRDWRRELGSARASRRRCAQQRGQRGGRCGASCRAPPRARPGRRVAPGRRPCALARRRASTVAAGRTPRAHRPSARRACRAATSAPGDGPP